MHAFDAMTVREKMDSTQKVTEEGGTAHPCDLTACAVAGRGLIVEIRWFVSAAGQTALGCGQCRR